MNDTFIWCSVRSLHGFGRDYEGRGNDQDLAIALNPTILVDC